MTTETESTLDIKIWDKVEISSTGAAATQLTDILMYSAAPFILILLFIIVKRYAPSLLPRMKYRISQTLRRKSNSRKKK